MAKILIVEDELVIALDMADQLRDAGFEVVGYAASVDGAVSIAKFAKPDVAIVDIHLHGELDGIEGAKLLRRAGVKVIFSSAWDLRKEVVSRAMSVEPVALSR